MPIIVEDETSDGEKHRVCQDFDTLAEAFIFALKRADQLGLAITPGELSDIRKVVIISDGALAISVTVIPGGLASP